ncbi:ROK family transcriptional regulator [Sulfobacillus harzensis]|uniref:ROK family protein n=1 Tax=Sulfobacillus harzensis TaxID=2729629 RepID=A0A7Y0L6L9_9FIRM|nr:ROK family transcriptional regulator [Sulfobacillus harzensis]NMP22884.1 ROK family protein [Sulfobacillus harzensis]
MSTTVDASVMRNVNKRTVLGLLYQRKTISRADISRQTGLNRATVSSLVDELISDKFVVEVGTGTSSGGRKPIILQFNADSGYVIGVDVQITHITTVLINAGRQIAFERRRDIDRQSPLLSREQLTDFIVEEIQLAKTHCPPSPHGLMGVGVGLPGLVNHHQGYALYLPNLGINDWAIADAISRQETLPVFVDNDANCGAWWQYLTSRVPHQLFINAGIGLGVGVIINGHLYRGADGIAGEAGHHSISPVGEDCSCGNIGCWEQYASERGLAHALQERGIDVPWPLPPDFVDTAFRAAQLGSHAHQTAFEILGEHLAVGLVNLLNMLNPSAVYIGGTIADAAPLVLPTIHAAIESRALRNNRRVTVEAVPANSVALGAAGLALAQSIDLLPTSLV